MIPLPDGIAPTDIQQWLHGGVCMYEVDGEFIPCVLDATVTGREGAGRLFTDKFTQVVPLTYTKLRAYWPLCGSVNIERDNVAIHVERRPAKQFKRTFTWSVMKVRVPRLDDLANVLPIGRRESITGPTYSTLKAIFYPIYPETYREALMWMEAGWFSVALNPRVIVAGDTLGKRMVYYRGRLAATLIGNMATSQTDEVTRALIARALGEEVRWTRS